MDSAPKLECSPKTELAPSSDSHENEPEPKSLSLGVQKEPKSDSEGNSEAGIATTIV